MYYTSVIILSCLSLLCLASLVKGNTHIHKDDKKLLYRSYLIILVSVLSEWFAVRLNGAPHWTRGLHMFVKLLDYTFTPAAGIFFVRQILGRTKTDRFTISVMLFNLAVHIASFFRGWTFYIDNQNVYHHGPYWWLYMAVFIYMIAYVICGFVIFSRAFERRNLSSLFLVIVIVITGILLQEIFGGYVRTTSLSLSIGSILLYIYYSDFSMLTYDEQISHQKSLLETDVLTGIYSRYAFYEALETYSQRKLPRNTVVFSFDINHLKRVNDTLGHSAGDELIKAAAEIISSIFSQYGKCYRIGGDEMAAVITISHERVPSLIAEMRRQCDAWIGEYSSELGIAVGHVSSEQYPSLVLEELYNRADTLMYEDKERMHHSSV